VEAGLFSGTDAPERLRAWRGAPRVLRLLAEVVHDDLAGAGGEDGDLAAAEALLARIDVLGLGGVGRDPLLLHGEGAGAWPVLRLAGERGLDTRIGLEDTLLLPDGSPAPDNEALVAAAVDVLAGAARG
jgi:hypothetical protein